MNGQEGWFALSLNKETDRIVLTIEELAYWM
jgi:hypothetical protein